MNKHLVACIVTGIIAPSAHAWGMADLLSVGIEAGGKLVGAAAGAAADAVKDSMRDPEAEAKEKAEAERKKKEQMQAQLDRIEARTDLRPIDRERLVLSLRKVYKMIEQGNAMFEEIQAQQRAERERQLTLGAIAGNVVDAASHAPSVGIAQAQMMAKDPIFRAQIRQSVDAADATANGNTLRTALSQVDREVAQEQAGKQMDTALQKAGEQARQQVTDLEEKVKAREKNEPLPAPAMTNDVFAADLGKRLWIEFEDSPKETTAIRKILQERGHSLAMTKEEAEIVYLFQGEYTIEESNLHKGLVKSVGVMLENPDQPIEQPAKKIAGSIGAGIGQLFGALGGVKAPASSGVGNIRQHVLLVIARQPKGGKEARASSLQGASVGGEHAAGLLSVVRAELYGLLGLKELLPST